MGLVTLREGTRIFCGVLSNLSQKSLARGLGEMLYFLRISVVSKMHDILYIPPNDGHEEKSGRIMNGERRAVRSSHLMLLTFDADAII